MSSVSGPMTSTASLLTTDTTSSSFYPSKKTKRPQSKKDYAAALFTLQSKYGLPQASGVAVPLPLSSKKSPASSTTASSSTTVEKAKKRTSSPLSLLRAKYRQAGRIAPSPS